MKRTAEPSKEDGVIVYANRVLFADPVTGQLIFVNNLAGNYEAIAETTVEGTLVDSKSCKADLWMRYSRCECDGYRGRIVNQH